MNNLIKPFALSISLFMAAHASAEMTVVTAQRSGTNLQTRVFLVGATAQLKPIQVFIRKGNQLTPTQSWTLTEKGTQLVFQADIYSPCYGQNNCPSSVELVIVE